jgi:hypothetical protein
MIPDDGEESPRISGSKSPATPTVLRSLDVARES